MTVQIAWNTQLAQKRGDDIARRRLGLAGLALGEIDPTRFRDNDALCRVRDHITTNAVDLWLVRRQDGTQLLAEHVARSLPALARCQGRYWRATLPDCIAAGLSDRTADCDTALALLSRIRIATAPILAALARLLRLGDYRRDSPDSVARVVGKLGVAAATAPFLAALAGLLGDPEEGVRHLAGKAVGGLGATAATPLILEVLAGMLGDTDNIR